MKKEKERKKECCEIPYCTLFNIDRSNSISTAMTSSLTASQKGSGRKSTVLEVDSAAALVSAGGGGDDEASVERIFQSKAVPPWQRQISVRAMTVSLVLGILFTFIVMKLNLTTGIIPSLNVSAGLLGFFFIKTWTKVIQKAGMLKQPFTRQENTVIQTCVVATSGIAFSGGFGSYLFGMSDVIAKQSPEANTPNDIKNPGLGWMIAFLFVVSFLGLFSVVPLRKVQQLIFIVQPITSSPHYLWKKNTLIIYHKYYLGHG